MQKREPRPFYGVDGNLLVEDLGFSPELVEEVLDDRFKRRFAMQCMFPGAVFDRHPQLTDELKKRRHRKAYKAHLRAKLLTGSAPRQGR